ncbi:MULTISPECIES: alpha/beta hydrolase [unclassified Coleofasciculus]|uniref:alpha/beta hydrolase n=1 Tax=unclassified Coleofasciculus TaxID=2692782 RepID=UPI00187F04B4|nr:MULTISPECIES: alpha/beta hydrolase [unclassified Coleofasciculus]MBE9126870.1 alpha/beta hydrolase [Coleofasciculus sp. LEGE 07081]MBE9150235.1 alpha/beta hydrolase [Coleofasciculus sp. LEGE 07092]
MVSHECLQPRLTDTIESLSWKAWAVKLRTGLGIALLNLGLSIAPVVIPTPVQGAEEIYFPYGLLEFSLPISALEAYAKEGKIEPELAFYANYVDPQQLEQLRQALITPIEVTPVAIAQFLYSPQGEAILRRLGEVIQTKAGQDGFYAIRAALIKAAADPEGFTLLNVLREFPTYGIRINSTRSFELIEELSALSRRTQQAIATVNQQSFTEARAWTDVEYPIQLPPDFSELPDLQQSGSFTYTKQTLTLTDQSRGRRLPVDLYLPIPSSPPKEETATFPVVVISHGLGSERMTFAYLAQHLASYGFAVAVPEHPGSNAEQLQALSKGLANEVTPPSELINRPLDIQFLLDELEQAYGEQLNLQDVGVVGQSFGGYTALALAGANINFEQLEEDCAQLDNSLNLSLLLQCRALELPQTDYQFRDPRVKAAIAINPVGSTIFGQSQFSQIQIPLMLVAGSNDTVAPALPEQIRPFTWLTTPEKYLVLLNKGTHFSALAPSPDDIALPAPVLGPDPQIAFNYMQALSVAFFKTYIAEQPEYQPYLNAGYAEYLSQDPMPLSLVESLMPKQLVETSRNEQGNNERGEQSESYGHSPTHQQNLVPVNP